MNAERPLPPGAICRLGSTRFRIGPGRPSVHLVPPHFRTFTVMHWHDHVTREYDLLTGDFYRVVPCPEPDAPVGESADGSRQLRQDPPRVVETTTGRVLLAVDRPDAFGAELSGDGRRLAVTLRHPDGEQAEADGDIDDGCYTRGAAVYDVDRAALLFEAHPPIDFNGMAHLTPDGAFLVVGGEWRGFGDEGPPEDGNAIYIYDGDSGVEIDRVALVGDEALQGLTSTGGVRIRRESGTSAIYDIVTRTRADFHLPYFEMASPGLAFGAKIDRESYAITRLDTKTGVVLGVTPCPFPYLPRDGSEPTLYVADDGTVTALSVVNRSMYVWDAPGGRRLAETVGAAMPMTALVFTADGREIRSACRTSYADDRMYRRWDAITGELLDRRELPGRSRYSWTAYTFLDEDRLYHYGEGAGVIDARDGSPFDGISMTVREGPWIPVATYRDHDHADFHAADNRGAPYLSRGDRIWTVAEADTRRWTRCLRAGEHRWDAVWSREEEQGPEFDRSHRTTGHLDSLSLSRHETELHLAPDASMVLLVPRREAIPLVLHAATGETLSTWSQAVHGPVAVHPSRPVVAAGSAFGESLCLYDFYTGATLSVVRETCYPHGLAWSPEGSRFVASFADGTALVFDVNHFLPTPETR